MDLITHGLLGATLAQATATDGARLPPRERLALGAMAAMLPDIDFVGFLINPLLFLADWHQGPTHSLVLLPLWAVLVGSAYVILRGRRSAFVEAVLVSALGLASHIGADLITAYGAAVLYPLSERRFSLATTFVIDPLLTAILLGGLLAGLKARRRLPAGVALAALGLCVVGQGVLQRQALELGLCVVGQGVLQRQALELGRSTAQAQGLSVERLTALAQPFSPFNWKLIAVDGDLYHEAQVNLAGHPPLVPRLPGLGPLRAIAESYRPPPELRWRTRHRDGDRPELHGLVAERWADPRFKPFRRFAVYPSLSRVDGGGAGACIWFTDLRYDLPALPNTFRYGFCRDACDQPWRLYRLRYFSQRSRQPVPT